MHSISVTLHSLSSVETSLVVFLSTRSSLQMLMTQSDLALIVRDADVPTSLGEGWAQPVVDAFEADPSLGLVALRHEGRGGAGRLRRDTAPPPSPVPWWLDNRRMRD